jgi:hypothetical protein
MPAALFPPPAFWSEVLSDIFREVEEDIRREQFKNLWDKYGLFVIGLAVAIVVIASASVGWRAYTKSQNEEMSAQYEAVAKAAETQLAPDAAAAFGALAAEGHGGYAVLAQMRQAEALQTAGDYKAAVAAYDAMASSAKAPQILRELAQLKAALILVDTASYEDIKLRLAPLTTEKGAWRNLAREAIGLSAYKAGSFVDAQKLFASIIEDSEAPAGLRERAHAMQALIAPSLPAEAAKVETNKEAPAQKAPGAKPE